MGVGNYPYFIMAQIYLAEWDFSCEQFAVTDNNTQWLVTAGYGGSSMWQYFKQYNIPCIFGMATNMNNNDGTSPFALICQGENSTKTLQDRRDATSIVYGTAPNIPPIPTTTTNNWIEYTLTEYPGVIFYLNKANHGVGGPTQKAVREPLITVDMQHGSGWTAEILLDVLERINFKPGEPTPIDPYSPGGTTDTGGGTGDHDDDSDDVPISDLPTLSASDTKFMTLYNPNLSQLNSLASWMWDPSVFDVNDLKKLFQSPMQAILGLSIVPVSPVIYDTPSQIWLGNLASPVSANKVASQYKRKPMGYVDISEYWGSYLDYSPYTRVEIFLPYIGIRPLNADDVMGRRITCVYNIDVVSGACVAQLQCGDSVLYQFAGNCASSVPVTGNDWTNVINAAMSVAITGATLAVGGAVGAASTAAAAVASVGSIAQNVLSAKPTIQKSGSMAGGSGFLGGQTPYFIITRPRQAVPEEQNKYTGYPSWITATLGNLSGMTYVGECHLENIPCTDEELNAIERLLKEGVIL